MAIALLDPRAFSWFANIISGWENFLLIAFLLSVWLWQSLVKSGQLKSGRQSDSDLVAIALKPEETLLLKNCFPVEVYGWRSLELQMDRLICYGTMRQASPRQVYRAVIAKVEAKFGDRFLVLFQNLPNSNLELKPTFVLLPNPSISLIPSGMWLLSLGSLLWAIAVLYWLGRDNLTAAIAYGGGVLAVLFARELAAHLVAKRYRLHLSPPWFLPGELGSFGSLSWCRSYLPHRRALFDLAIAPALAGLSVSLLLLAFGRLAQFGFPNTLAIPQVSSFLLEFLRSKQLINLNSALTMAGNTGILITGLSLIPITPLAGGQLIQAMYGQTKAEIVGKVMRLVVLAMALLPQPWLKLFALYLFLVDAQAVTVLDEVSESGNGRDLIGLLLFALCLAILLPSL